MRQRRNGHKRHKRHKKSGKGFVPLVPFVAVPLMWIETDCNRYGVLSPSEDDPAKTFRPSLRVTVWAFVRLEPSLARKPFTVTDSPTLTEFLDQPRLINPAGGPSSTSQLTTLPLASFTST